MIRPTLLMIERRHRLSMNRRWRRAKRHRKQFLRGGLIALLAEKRFLYRWDGLSRHEWIVEAHKKFVGRTKQRSAPRAAGDVEAVKSP
jgi:hypothetical protein